MKKALMVFGASVVAVFALSGGVRAASDNGRAGSMPAFYDDEEFLINLKELSENAAASIIANNQSLNIIYESEDCVPEGQTMFVAVIDAVPGDEFNPLWREVEIEFDNPEFSCQQLTSDEQIDELADAGLITLEPTDEVYRCSVIGGPA